MVLYLRAVYEFITPTESSKLSKLTPFQELMMTLIKLRLNLSMQNLAHRFSISCSTVSHIFLKWLTIMDIRLQPLELWLDREDLRRTMPDCLRYHSVTT